MLGYKPDELLGRNMHAMVLHSHADGTPYPEQDCAIYQTVRDLDTVRVSNEVFWRKDGSSFPVEYVARPQVDSTLGSRGGKAVGVVVAFRDTTERRALDRMKDEFISTVSHELRTPLTSLRAALGLVTGGALAKKPERQQQMLEIAIGNTDRLIRLVNDFLDIERISSGNAELHSAMCAASTLFQRTAGLQDVAADKKDVRFEFHPNGVEVFADPDRILQALTNLVSNAIKFSPAGGTITLSAHLIDETEARFDIHDEGRGIPPDKLEAIFERFEQVDASDSRAMGGTGLGLAICRSIIAQHGGSIWATSPPGEGATFHFTLPTRPASHLR
jgi:PAS domain S-box-containing protein